MEIDLVAIDAQDKPAILLGKEPCDSAVVGDRVELDVSASLANVVFEAPAGRVESVADRHVDILMGVVRRGIAADDDLAAGNLQVDANAK